MNQKQKDKVIKRAINFIKENTNEDSQRIGSAIIEELRLVENLKIPIVSGSLLPTMLMRIHPELTYSEAESLMEFAKSKTITHEECYGDGSIIYPMWKEANYR